jgi:oligosaccharide repeat unit polymerase
MVPASMNPFSWAGNRAVNLRAADLWWLHPVRIVLLVLIPIYLSVLAYDFKRVVQNVYVPGGFYAFGLLLILSLGVGAAWALSQREFGGSLLPPRVSRRALMALLIPTLLAYAIWFGPLLARPELLAELVSGERREVRDSISTIPGITTFTQFGVAYTIGYAIKCGTRMQRVSRIEHIGFALVVVMATFRAFAWAERLALIEVLVCFGVARMAYLPIQNPRRWRIAVVSPAFAPFVLYAIFTASEYFRSWDFYSRDYDSVWAFTLERLVTYYATAVNNGIGMLAETRDWPYFSGVFAVEWAYILPGVGKLLEMTFGSARDDYLLWLETFARPEFNSPTAYFRVMLDVGYLGSIVYFLAHGYIIGRAYAGFRRGHLFGLLAYPVSVLFLIESLRYSYLAEPRFVPLTIGLIILGLDMRTWRRSPGAYVP